MKGRSSDFDLYRLQNSLLERTLCWWEVRNYVSQQGEAENTLKAYTFDVSDNWQGFKYLVRPEWCQVEASGKAQFFIDVSC